MQLNEELAIICEGGADKNFLAKLIEDRGLPPFDIVEAEGIGNLTQKLRAIRANQVHFDKVRAIIIVADSGHSPQATMKLLRKLIKGAGQYSIPATPLVLSAGKPRIAIVLIPDPMQGGSLESLLYRALIGRKAWLDAAIGAFLSKGGIQATGWSAEKLAKAQFGAAVAATFKRDPNRAVSMAFKSRPGNPALLTTKSPAFNVVERWLRELSAEAMQ